MLGPADSRIRQKLRAARPNQQQLAATLGRSQSWVSKYLSDGNVIADPDHLVAIAEFLGVTVTELIGDASPVSKKKTAARPRDAKITDLWTRASPKARRYVRQYLEADVAARGTRASR